jgi:hypothetical protein
MRQNGSLFYRAKQFEKHLKDIKRHGFLYMMQLIPEYNPNRIKFGFAYNVERRFYDYKISCPNVTLIAKWECVRHMERESIRQITKSIKCSSLSFELFECDDFRDLLNSANNYFQIDDQSISSTSMSLA